MEGHIAGGFHPDEHAQLLTRLFAEVNLSPTWYQSADIRQLTAGTLGIPPTHTPTAEQTSNLWGVSVKNARHSAAQMAKAAAACFDALEHFAAGGSDCQCRPDDELRARCSDAISRSHRESSESSGAFAAVILHGGGFLRPLSSVRSMVSPQPGRPSTHFWPSPSLLRR